MSKRLKEVFANMRCKISFLETIETQPCERKGTLDIIIEDQQDDGKPLFHETLRSVKVCRSHQECQYYEVQMDPVTAKGKIRVEGMKEGTYTIMQTDENAQEIGHDMYSTTYEVNGEKTSEAYASVHFSSQNGFEQSLRIMNCKNACTQLELFKILRDENGNALDASCDMSFSIHICNDAGYAQDVQLSAANHFHCIVDGLIPGKYQIYETDADACHVSYRLNLGKETCDHVFDLCGTHNELEIINEQKEGFRLSVESYIRTQKGELYRPCEGFECMFRVLSQDLDQVYCLHAENAFSVDLYGLRPGCYDICEISEHDGYATSYIVNDHKESAYANVELTTCEHGNVMIIHTECDDMEDVGQDSLLRICKYIRRFDGCITKPDEKDIFKVNVSGCGMMETFVLNCNNNYCVEITDLCDGVYDICEVGCSDFKTTYIVNDECERTSACVDIRDGCTYQVAIINEEKNRGHVRVCKYIRNAYGDLVKPQKPMCFHVYLSSYFCKKQFVLNADNDWCMCFDDLYLGSYEVREEDDHAFDIKYQVNGERECRYARFFIEDACDNEVKIINSVRRCNTGVLKIAKYEETACEELVKPSHHECFDVEVSGPCFCEVYSLSSTNNWCILLEGLQPGEYQVRELNAHDYDVHYVVNREIMDDAIVYLSEYNQEVMVINHRKQSGYMKLSTQLRDCDGMYHTPAYGEEFEILLESPQYSCTTTLCAENGWCVLLDQLPEGVYRVIQKDTFGYQVAYQFHGKEEPFARITLGKCDEEIVIVNAEKECSGNLTVTKYVESEDGVLYKPCPQEEFLFELRGKCFTRTYRLHERNDFCVYFDDLEEGNYEICELDDRYDVMYRIQGECHDTGCITLGHEDIQVDMINRRKEEGLISIDKRIIRNGKAVLPSQDECFKFICKGKNFKEVFTLHAENDFTVCLRDMPHQHYEIKELNATCAMYEVNGVVCNQGSFLYDGQDMHVTIMNEEHLHGCMEIRKMLLNAEGELVKPCKEDHFQVVVESDAYKQKVTLCHENNFCMQLFDLPDGHYEIYEVDTTCAISYQINDIPCEKAIVDMFEEDMCVLVINDPTCQGKLEFAGVLETCDGYCLPKENDHIALCIMDEHTTWNLELCCENAFSTCLEGLKPGAYRINSPNTHPVCFEIDKTMFEQDVCVELNQEHVIINVIKKPAIASLTISGYAQDGCEDFVMPDKTICWDMVLIGNGNKANFRLDKTNDWQVCFDGLENGQYELCSANQKMMQYQLPQQPWKKECCFEVCDNDLCIALSQASICGILHLHAMVLNAANEVVLPNDDDMFYMDVETPQGCKTYVFQCENNWQQDVSMEAHQYMVTQKPHKAYDACYYMVNDQKETSVCVYAQDEDIHVQAINVKNGGCGSLRISKVIKDPSCQCLHHPSQSDAFEIDVQSTNYHEVIQLNADNKFQTTLDHLENGTYTVRELHACGYVSYIINGKEESARGIVTICDDHNAIKIINEKNDCQTGSIEVCKLIKDEEGCYRCPDASKSYWMQIKGENGIHRLLLNQDDHFHASLRNLQDGWYEIREEDAQTPVRYVVNNAAPTESGIVHVMQNANTVNVINCMRQDGDIHIQKQVQGSDGGLHTPQSGSYRVHVTSPGYNEIFTLHAENDYHVHVQGLKKGLYVIMEMEEEHVTYIVNGGSAVDYAIVEVKGDTHHVQVINPTESKEKGSITLAKYIRFQQQLTRPQGEERFIFHVSRPGFNRLYTLDSSNDWMLSIPHLDDGDYVITETAALDPVTYIINGGSEVDRAVVPLRGDHNTVQIINQRNLAGGSILLDKFIRNATGLVKPTDVAYKVFVYVSKPGYGETFELNVGNDWQYRIDNLESGTYVVNEVGNDAVTFIVNGGSEVDRGVVDVNANTNVVQIINALENISGTIVLDKYMRNDNELVKPQDDFIARIRISKPGFQEIYELNARNQWRMSIRGLENGVYVIDEMDMQQGVTYRINGGSEVNNAVVNVEDNMHQVTIINTIQATYGSIRIEKFIRDAQGILQRPSNDFSVRVHVSKPGYNEVFTLNASNDFSITLTELMDGYYVLNEIETQDSVTYVINGGSEVKNGVVHVMKNSNYVQMIDAPIQRSGAIFLTKLIRDGNGLMRPPRDDERFLIDVQGNAYAQQVTLNRANNWSMTLHNLAPGEYQVQEVAQNGYTVTYIVDNGTQQDRGSVQVVSNTHTVKIVNTASSHQALLEITKWIKQANGSLIRPADGDVFEVEIYNEDILRKEILNKGNQFTMQVQDLPLGTYNVREIRNDAYITTYRVNGGAPSNSATVTLHGVDTQLVEVINERVGNQNTIEVFKYTLDDSGNYLPPQAKETFQFEIIGNGFQDVYDMNVSNDWHQTLTQYPSGTYQIREIGSPFPVQYLVNSAVLQEEAFITAEPSKTNVVGIINKLSVNTNGKMTLTKRIRSASGELLVPNAGESYVIRVLGPSFERYVALDAANQYSFPLQSLAYGLYTLEETSGNSQVTFKINQNPETSRGALNIENDTVNEVLVINATRVQSVSATHDTLKFVIE